MAKIASEPIRRWRNSSLHREVDTDRARWVTRVVLGAVVAALPFAAYLLQTMSYIQTRYALENVRVREEHLVESERRYRIEKASLEALPKVEERADRELGLARPTPSQVIVVTSGELARPSPPGPRPLRPAR
jgi:cell division protein FtsL